MKIRKKIKEEEVVLIAILNHDLNSIWIKMMMNFSWALHRILDRFPRRTKSLQEETRRTRLDSDVILINLNFKIIIINAGYLKEIFWSYIFIVLGSFSRNIANKHSYYMTSPYLSSSYLTFH